MSARYIWTDKVVRKFMQSAALQSLTVAARFVYQTLHSHSDMSADPVWPSVATIAKTTGLHIDTVRDMLKDLQRIGAIRIEHRHGQSNLIHFRTSIREPLGISPPPGSETPPWATDPTPPGSETLGTLGPETPPKNQEETRRRNNPESEVVEIKETVFNIDSGTVKETGVQTPPEKIHKGQDGREYRLINRGGINYREYLQWKK